jgi:large subunit ribosomal protein L32
MAVPKKRKSKARTRARRSVNDRLTAPTVNACPHCGAPRRPHRACPECGQYGSPAKPEQVVEVWEY